MTRRYKNRPDKQRVAKDILAMLSGTDRKTYVHAFELPGQFGVSQRIALEALDILLRQRLIQSDRAPHFAPARLHGTYELTEAGRGGRLL